MGNDINTQMLFSRLSGYNIYVPSKHDPSGMSHFLSNDDVIVRPMPALDLDSVNEKWRYFVENPVDISSVLWPIDIVDLPDGIIGLVFRKRALPKLEPLKNLLYNSLLLSWKKDEIKQITANLLLTFSDIHENGYAYHSFDVEHIYFSRSNGKVFFDFSIGMARHFDSKVIESKVDFDSISIEFLPPWRSFEDRAHLSLVDDYYSISALIFRLLIGRMPYQGRIMDGQGDMMDLLRDVDPADHYRMFEHYHSNPIFVFDPNDKRNSIGLYTHEEKNVELWEDLPDEIKLMFIETFSNSNVAAPQSEKKLYKPSEWYDALKKNEVI